MQYYQFPDPEQFASPEGLIYVGGDLSTDLLVSSYSQGIFPWPHEGYPMLWFCPPERGVIYFDKLHISHSLKKLIKKNKYQFTINKAFDQVIEHCSLVPRKDSHGTWITDEIKNAYIELHKQGYAMSVECWDQSKLVGGIYGVFLKNYFSAESMFHLEDNTSKMSLIKLVEFLMSKGFTWMDIQMVTSVTRALGGEYITRSAFLKLIK